MDIVISSGHGLKVRGAKGVLDEVDEARKVTDRVAELLRAAGVGVKVFHDNTSATVSANLSAITGYHNSQKRDRDVSVHFNAFQTTSKAMGTECLYVSQQSLAAKVSAAMANAGKFTNRGAKKRTDLAFLNRCAKPAVLIEVCFVDSSHDARLYRENFEAVCRGIAEAIGDVRISGEPPPVEPAPPPTVEPEFPTGENVVDVAISVTGKAMVTLNGDVIDETVGHTANRIALTMEHEGDIVVTINGEDFQIEAQKPSIPRPTLRRGSRGDDVRVLQTCLDAKPIDGIFGAGTETAVQKFQREQKLTDDGVVGPQTWAALEKHFHIPETEPPVWFEDIVCTVFGGAKDPNKSAYPPYDNVTDSELSVALPWRFANTGRPKVRVINRANNREVVCAIRDIGPWLTDDDYWTAGERPLAETHWKSNQPLQRGPNKGKVPNGAGIDLTPAAARAIDLVGKANVDWAFVDEGA
jgi:N-acetylmuramoyl-L-alanine amidase/Putative peptidoglycan binding domain